MAFVNVGTSNTIAVVTNITGAIKGAVNISTCRIDIAIVSANIAFVNVSA